MTTVTTEQVSGYRRVQEQRTELVEVMQRLDAAADRLAMHAWARELEALRSRVSAETFKVLVLGEFKRGKSTLINAMLGRKVLPSHTLPKTAVLTVVKWGEQPRAILHHRPVDGETPPRAEVPVDDIDQYVSIDRKNRNAVSPYSRLELFWDLDICRNGVEIIDSPGLNEHEQRDQTTLEVLADVDAVVFMFVATAPNSASEAQYIGRHITRGWGDPFLVVNRINEVPEDEIEDVRGDLLDAFSAYTADLGRVFFVDALGALRARDAGDEDADEASGVPAFERALHGFLINDRARAKLESPLRTLRPGLAVARATIPQERAYLAQSADELRDRYERQQQPLHDLELRRDHMLASVKLHVEKLRNAVDDAARAFYLETADTIPAWAEEFEPESRLTLAAWKGQEQAEQAVDEVGRHIGGRVDEAFATWRDRKLEPVMREHMEELRVALDREAAAFVEQVEEIRGALVHDSGAAVAPTADLPSAQERLLAAAIGVIVPGSALSGATLGVDAMLKTVMPQLAVAAMGVLFLGTHPAGIAALLFGTAVGQSWFQLEGANRKLKQRAAAAVGEDLREHAFDRAHSLAEAAAGRVEQLGTELARASEGEIESLREQVQSVLTAKEAGEEAVAAKNAELDALDTELDEIEHRLDALQDAIAAD
jgi:hypothetical protein